MTRHTDWPAPGQGQVDPARRPLRPAVDRRVRADLPPDVRRGSPRGPCRSACPCNDRRADRARLSVPARRCRSPVRTRHASVPAPMIWLLAARRARVCAGVRRNAARTLEERPWRARAQQVVGGGSATLRSPRTARSRRSTPTRLDDHELARHLEAVRAARRATGTASTSSCTAPTCCRIGLFLDACRGLGHRRRGRARPGRRGRRRRARASTSTPTISRSASSADTTSIGRASASCRAEVVEASTRDRRPRRRSASRLDRVDDIVPLARPRAFDILLRRRAHGVPRARRQRRRARRVAHGAACGARTSRPARGSAGLDQTCIEATVPEARRRCSETDARRSRARSPSAQPSAHAGHRSIHRCGSGRASSPTVSMLPPAHAPHRRGAAHAARPDRARPSRRDLEGFGVGTDRPRASRASSSSVDDAIMRLEPGDVLVVRATSPAFNAVLPLARALVTEHGGAISHAAIAARELGDPGGRRRAGRDPPDPRRRARSASTRASGRVVVVRHCASLPPNERDHP